MKSRDFCYWLRDYLNLDGNEDLTIEQVNLVKDELAKVESEPSFKENNNLNILQGVGQAIGSIPYC